MPVVSCGERRSERTAEWREDGTRNYRRTYYVQTNSKQDGPVVVLLSADLPQMFDAYRTEREFDNEALVVARRPKQLGVVNWEVEIEYDSKRESQRNQENPRDNAQRPGTNPESWWEKVSLTFETHQVPLLGVKAAPVVGEATFPAVARNAPIAFGICNSAGEPFDPPPVKDQSEPVLTIETFKLQFRIQDVRDYVNTLNNDNFWGANPRQWKCANISTSGLEHKKFGETTIWYYPVKYEFRFNRDQWDLRILDQGSYYKDGAQVLAFLTDEGQPYIGLLDGTGNKLGVGANHVFLRFRVYDDNPFMSLGLPNEFP